MAITTIKLTDEQYETLLFICNGETIFKPSEILKQPLIGFLGENVKIESNTDVIHFVK